MSELEPLLVPVLETRWLLGGIGNNKFWKLAKAGELELVGSERKRGSLLRASTATSPGFAPANSLSALLRRRGHEHRASETERRDE
jgi:hypothetical protein